MRSSSAGVIANRAVVSARVLLPGAPDRVPHVGGVLRAQVPSTSRSRSCSNPSNSRFPPPSTSGAVEIASSSTTPAATLADQVGATTEGDPPLPA